MIVSNLFDELQDARRALDLPLFFFRYDAVVEECRDNPEKADLLSWNVAELVSQLNRHERPDDALRVVVGCLDKLADLPLPEYSREYAAQMLLTTVRDDLGLIERIEALMPDDVIDYVHIVNMAEAFAAIGLRERAFHYLDRAMAEGSGKQMIPHRPGLKALYDNDLEFCEMVEHHHQRQEKMAAYLEIEPDPADFDQVMAAARVELLRDHEQFRPERIVALADFKDSPCRAEIDPFLRDGFELLRQRARRKRKIINFEAFDALARTIAILRDSGFTDMLLREFKLVQEEGYELLQVVGTIALALGAVGYRGAKEDIEAYFKEWEWRYEGEEFIMKTSYALWMMTRDAAAALRFIQDQDHKAGLAYAAAALADLNAVEYRQELYQAAYPIYNKVTLKAFLEAWSHLGRQTEAPAYEDRMIHLFGVMTPTRKVDSGGNNDNQFVQMVRRETGNLTVGYSIESDSAVEPDR